MVTNVSVVIPAKEAPMDAVPVSAKDVMALPNRASVQTSQSASVQAIAVPMPAPNAVSTLVTCLSSICSSLGIFGVVFTF